MQAKPYKNYLLALLTVILLFNYVDRVALGLMLEDIKHDLQLSDTQLGALTGIAFAFFYSVMGVPIARWADRGNRVTIIVAASVLYSVAVGLSGLAQTFAQLLLIRIVVAVGEAGCLPPSFSLIADYFNRAERPRASAIYGLAGAWCAVVGYLGAGWLLSIYGWRVTFMFLGLPGLVLALIAWLTLKEPRMEVWARRMSSREQCVVATSTPPTFRKVCVTLWASVTFRQLVLCVSGQYFLNYGISVWVPAFFTRSFGLTTWETGIWLAGCAAFGGLVGAYVGGELASRYASHNERLQLRLTACAMAVGGFLLFAAYMASSHYVALGLMGLVAAVLCSTNGPLTATIQTLVPENMRAVAFSLLYLFANLIGMGLGPLAAGALSDGLRPLVGEESLRYTLVALTPGYLFVAWHAWKASETVTGDITAMARSKSSGAASAGELHMTDRALAESEVRV